MKTLKKEYVPINTRVKIVSETVRVRVREYPTIITRV